MTQRILVAEDEMIVAFDLCDTVAEAGFEVEGPHSGVSSAILAIQKSKPDLAILDVELSDGNALEFARLLADEDVPVIFHTASATESEIAEQFPGVAFLEKPCPPAQLLAAVQATLQTD